MKTVTVLKAIDYSEKQAGICWLDLDIPEPGQTGTGRERWEPADSDERLHVARTFRSFWTENVYGIALYDTEMQFDEALR